MSVYTEDNLVQKTTAEYLVNSLGWNESVYAMQEVFGAAGTLGRTDEGEVLLVRYLRPALENLNSGLPAAAYDDAVRILADTSVSMGLDAINREKYKLLLDGIPVRYTAADGTKKKATLRVFDFDDPDKNHFLCVRELWLRGSLGRRRRADVVGFVNGVPLVFMELKNVTKDISIAYRDNFCDYRKVVPQIFHFNAFVILANGIDAKIGTHSAKFKFFHAWKRLSEDEPGAVDMETLLKGTCSKANLLDLFENFIVYDESAGAVAKILARNHPRPQPPVPWSEPRGRGGKGAHRGAPSHGGRTGGRGSVRAVFRQAGRVLAHAGFGQELLDGLFHPQGAPQARRELHVPAPDRSR